jgi:hypothetical protein
MALAAFLFAGKSRLGTGGDPAPGAARDLARTRDSSQYASPRERSSGI